MCGLVGYVCKDSSQWEVAKNVFKEICYRTSKRGIDAFGVSYKSNYRDRLITDKIRLPHCFENHFSGELPAERKVTVNELVDSIRKPTVLIANFRGIPTTEDFDRDDFKSWQPFVKNGCSVVHNGLLSNDQQLLKKYNIDPIMSNGTDIDSYAFVHLYEHHKESMNSPLAWYRTCRELEGSWATMLLDEKYLYISRTFPGLWSGQLAVNDVTVTFYASERQALDHSNIQNIVEIPMYSTQSVNLETWETSTSELYNHTNAQSAIVVLSGGLDSTTAATVACQKYNKIKLLHFKYGALAENPETNAVIQIHQYLKNMFPRKDISLEFFETDLFQKLGGSTLTDPNKHKDIAEGEAGIEKPNEWVPFRNGVMIALAAAYCDRYKMDRIILGLNREEAGSFPDNSQEFYDAWNPVLAIGALHSPKIEMPLGHLMKWHIVKYAMEIGAPIHLSWSCYRNGVKPCGTCGPCTMRRRAFAMNNMQDMQTYSCEEIQ